MSAEMYLALQRPRARVVGYGRCGTFVALYHDGLAFRPRGSAERLERLQFGNDRHAGVARLLEEIGSLGCPACFRSHGPIARDVWQAIDLAAGRRARCEHCEARVRLFDDDVLGLVLVAEEWE
jgi:hypothetical protein